MRFIKSHTSRSALLIIMGLVFLLLTSSSTVLALSQEQRNLLNSGILYFNEVDSNNCQINSSVASNNNVYVIGDSYSSGVKQHGLKDQLEKNGFKVVGYNDDPGRSITGAGNQPEKGSGIDAIQQDKDAIQQAGTVIIILGTNQPSTYDSQIPEFMKQLNTINNGARKLWVNVDNVSQKPSEINPANDAINKYASEFNYSVIDWYSLFEQNKAKYGNDLHPSPEGYDALTQLIVDAVGQPSSSNTNATVQLPTADPNKDMGEENEPYIWSYLISKGLTPIQAAGIMGNLQDEGHFEPRIVEYGALNSRGETSAQGKPSSLDNNAPTTPGSYGLAQWLGGRKDSLRNFAEKQGLPAGNLQVQLDFLWHELNDNDIYNKNALQPLLAATDVNTASEVITKNYEIPGDIPGRTPVRQKNAANLLKKYAGIGGITSGCNKSGIGGAFGWDLDGSNAMVYYAQTDKRWADKSYGIGTIEDCACGPTSMAMIAATLNGDSSITPPEVAKYYYEHGGQVGGEHCGSNWAWEILASKYGLNMKNIGVDFNETANTLKSGGLILVSVGAGTFTSGGHLMVIRKVSEDGNSFYLADPYSDEGRTHGESNKKAYTIDELRSDGNLRNMWSFTK